MADRGLHTPSTSDSLLGAPPCLHQSYEQLRLEIVTRVWENSKSDHMSYSTIIIWVNEASKAKHYLRMVNIFSSSSFIFRTGVARLCLSTFIHMTLSNDRVHYELFQRL